MNNSEDRFYLKAFFGLALFHFLIWFSLGMVLDLHPDTADHWVWSRFLSWGYYEHPPMIAWVIRLFTSLLGNRQVALAFGSQLITLLSFLPIFLLARRLFNGRTAFLSVLCLEATPLIIVGSMIFIIDTVLLLFFLWAALGFWNGIERGDKKALYWTGATLGLALLSKITAVLFLLPCFIFLLVSGERRKVFRSPHLYLALLLSLVIFSPFIYWNMSHGWISIQNQLEKGLTGGRDWNQTLGFWFGQPLILGPVLFFFALKAIREGLKKFNLEARYAYLILLTVMPILVFGLASFRGKYSDPTWTDIGWPFGAILLGAYFSDRLSTVSFKKVLMVGALIFITSWLPIGMMALHALHPFFPIPIQNDRTLEMRGWRELGEAIGREYPRYFPGKEKRYVVAEEYQLAAAVSFYAPQHPIPFSFGKAKRNFWVTPQELKINGAFLVCKPEKCEEDQQKVRPWFQTIRYVSTIPFYRQGQLAKEFRIYFCTNSSAPPETGHNE